MVSRKGRRHKLIRKIVEIIHDAGEPLSAQEILNRSLHLHICPSLPQLSMMLRKHPEFIITGKIKSGRGRNFVNLYWLSDIVQEVSEIWRCHICNEVVTKEIGYAQTESDKTCRSCYSEKKREERRNAQA